MKKTKVINSDISRVIAQMGHFDKLSIGDAGASASDYRKN